MRTRYLGHMTDYHPIRDQYLPDENPVAIHIPPGSQHIVLMGWGWASAVSFHSITAASFTRVSNIRRKLSPEPEQGGYNYNYYIHYCLQLELNLT